MVDPQLVIHGGDLGHLWSCFRDYSFSGYFRGALWNDRDAQNINNWQCRTPQEEFQDLWDILYDAGIPMISNFGNHDWYPAHGTGNPWVKTRGLRDAVADRINQQSSDFVRDTYERSAALGLEMVEETLPLGAYGQSMFRSVFRGVQLASFNAAFNWQSYDDFGIYDATDQLDRLKDSLMEHKNSATIFFSHFPLSKRRLRHQIPTVDHVLALMGEFANGNTIVHHLSGQYHAEMVEDYAVTTESNVTVTVRDHVAAYPHHWGSVRREPGFFAVLVSPKDGVIRSVTGQWKISAAGCHEGISLSHLDK